MPKMSLQADMSSFPTVAFCNKTILAVVQRIGATTACFKKHDNHGEKKICIKTILRFTTNNKNKMKNETKKKKDFYAFEIESRLKILVKDDENTDFPFWRGGVEQEN